MSLQNLKPVLTIKEGAMYYIQDKKYNETIPNGEFSDLFEAIEACQELEKNLGWKRLTVIDDEKTVWY